MCCCGKTNARQINSHVALLKLPVKIAQAKPSRSKSQQHRQSETVRERERERKGELPLSQALGEQQ